MVNLDLFQTFLKDSKRATTDITQEKFEQIAGYVEKEQMESAIELIEVELAEGNFDIRIISYYLYAHFLEKGILSFVETVPLLTIVLDQYWEILRPHNRKERQVENSLNWLFTHVLNKLKYLEKLSKEGKPAPLWKKSTSFSRNEAQLLLQTTENFKDHFFKKWPDSSIKERLVHWTKKIEDMLAFHQEEQIPEQEIPSPEPPVEIKKEDANTDTFDSPELLVFIQKLKTFEALIEKKEFLKAAMVSQDISKRIENFDPRVYFPRLFSQYFSLLARHISQLSDQWKDQESIQWKSLENLYKTDIDQFVNW